MKKIRILFFIESLEGGGAEKVLRNLVNNMDQSKFDITVQTVEPCRHSDYLVEGIKYKSIKRHSTGVLNKMMDYWYRFCTELKLTYPIYIQGGYDIEVAYLECGSTKVMAASMNKHAIKIAWVHCDLQKKGIIDKKIGRYYSKFDKVVCVSQDVKKTFHRLYGQYVPSTVLYNVVDEEEVITKAKENIEWNRNKSKIQLLAIGRLTKQKNFTYLIESCAKLAEAGYSFQLTVLGEGEERLNLQKQINELGLQQIIELKGFVANPYPYIYRADIIVCSSIYEGISTVIQEALILGKPIVTTPCAGMKELLGESEYGLIVQDDKQGLYNGIKTLLDSSELLKKYAEASEKRGKELSKYISVNRIENFFIKSIKNT